MKFLILLLFTGSALAAFNPFPPNPLEEGSLTQKADIYSHDGAADAILSSGTSGQLLSIDPVEDTGLKWIDPPVTSPTTILGDMIRRGAAADERLGIGTVGQLLTSDGTTFNWQDAPVSTTLTTKGDIQTHDGTNNERLGVGVDQSMLIADSAEATGLRYATDLPPIIKQNYSANSLLVNSSFAEEGTGWTITETNCPVTYVSGGALFTCTTGTFSLKQNVATGLKENEGLSNQIVYTASVEGAKWTTLSNDVRQSELALSVDASPQNSSVVSNTVNATSNGIEVFADSNITGTVFVSNVRMKHEDVTYKTSGAHFVGELNLSNDLLYQRDNTSWGKMLSGSGTPYSTIGGVTVPTNPLEAGVKVSSFRTDGYYKVKFQGVLYNINNTNTCVFSVAKYGSGFEGHGQVINSGGEVRYASQISANIRFQESDTGEIFLINKNSASTTCGFYGNASNPSTVSVHFFPDHKSTIVTQDTELTDDDINTFSMNYDTTGSGALRGEKSDNISIVKESQGVYMLSFTGLTVPPHCSATGSNLNDSANDQFSCGTSYNDTPTSTQQRIICKQGIVRADPKDLTIVCRRGRADTIRSQTVVGNFSQIRSDDLVLVEASENNGAAYADATAMLFLEKSDPSNAWDGTTFTVPVGSSGRYKFDGMVQTTVAATRFFTLYVDRGAGYIAERNMSDNTSTNIYKIGATIDLNEGDSVQVRVRNGSLTTNQTQDDLYHWLTITQQPTKQSIVQNLMKDHAHLYLDKYQENETKWGKWNGEQLYRRCYTATVDKAVDAAILTTWAIGLKPKHAIKFSGDLYSIYSTPYNASYFVRVIYDSSNGQLRIELANYKVGADTSFCMEYTR